MGPRSVYQPLPRQGDGNTCARSFEIGFPIRCEIACLRRLTPDLSRAAKRRRLEGIVRPHGSTPPKLWLQLAVKSREVRNGYATRTRTLRDGLSVPFGC